MGVDDEWAERRNRDIKAPVEFAPCRPPDVGHLQAVPIDPISSISELHT